jgi:hypothetical protein
MEDKYEEWLSKQDEDELFLEWCRIEFLNDPNAQEKYQQFLFDKFEQYLQGLGDYQHDRLKDELDFSKWDKDSQI